MKHSIHAWDTFDPISEIHAIGRLHIQSAGGGMPFETHENAFELLLLESGSKSIAVAGEQLEMHGGDVLLLHPGEVHGAPEKIQNRTSMVYILFPDPACCAGFLGLTAAERTDLGRFLHEEAPRFCHVHAQAQRRFVSLFHACKPATGELTGAVRRAHFALLLDDYRRCVHTTMRELSPEIARVLEKIRAERDYIPSVSELAACAYLSESRFKQKFRQQTGMPPMEYILRHKIEEALQMMKNGGVSIPSVAAALGFSSDKHFTDAFRRYMGCTPAQYVSRQKAADFV